MHRVQSPRKLYWKSMAFALAGSVLAAPAVAGCWAPQEKALWATDELEGVLTVSFRNALTCAPVANAKVLIGDQETQTNGMGLVRFPAPTELDDVAVPIEVSAEGYQKGRGYLVFAFNAPLQNRFLLSPRLTADKARFVLSWADQPRDLDLHFIGPNFHISYRDMKNAPNEARLDRDATDGYGPETITAKNIRPDAHYELWVHNYTGGGAFGRSAQAQLYLSDGNSLAVVLPQTEARWVKVAEIDQGNVRIVNQPSPKGPAR